MVYIGGPTIIVNKQEEGLTIGNTYDVSVSSVNGYYCTISDLGHWVADIKTNFMLVDEYRNNIIDSIL